MLVFRGVLQVVLRSPEMIRMAFSGELVGLVGLSGDKGQTSNYVEVTEVSDMEF